MSRLLILRFLDRIAQLRNLQIAQRPQSCRNRGTIAKLARAEHELGMLKRIGYRFADADPARAVRLVSRELAQSVRRH